MFNRKIIIKIIIDKPYTTGWLVDFSIATGNWESHGIQRLVNPWLDLLAHHLWYVCGRGICLWRTRLVRPNSGGNMVATGNWKRTEPSASHKVGTPKSETTGQGKDSIIIHLWHPLISYDHMFACVGVYHLHVPESHILVPMFDNCEDVKDTKWFWLSIFMSMVYHLEGKATWTRIWTSHSHHLQPRFWRPQRPRVRVPDPWLNLGWGTNESMWAWYSHYEDMMDMAAQLTNGFTVANHLLLKFSVQRLKLAVQPSSARTISQFLYIAWRYQTWFDSSTSKRKHLAHALACMIDHDYIAWLTRC